METDRDNEREGRNDPAAGFGFLAVLCFALCVLCVSALVI